MFEELKEKVCAANLELVAKGVVIYTWGNVSQITEDRKYMVIKPSGVDYDGMKLDDMVVVDVQTGKVADGHYKPSSDTPTHLEFYRHFSSIGGIVHTHSVNAVAFAQAGMAIPTLGTIHADYFYRDIPCKRELTEEVKTAYEVNTGKDIIEHFENGHIDPTAIRGCVVKNHGPFAWGKDAADAVYNAVVMEKVAEMDLKTLLLYHPRASMAQYVLDKHYMRKHGPNAYYGQEIK